VAASGNIDIDWSQIDTTLIESDVPAKSNQTWTIIDDPEGKVAQEVHLKTSQEEKSTPDYKLYKNEETLLYN
jgi:hypothetical protein